MDAHSVKHVVASAFTLFLCAAPAGYAAVFKWTDTEGSVTYSTQPPPDPGKVRNLAQLDIDTRGRQPHVASRAPTQERVPTMQEPSLSRPDTWLKGTNPPPAPVERSTKTEPLPSVTPEPDRSPRDADIANREAEAVPRAPMRGVREAARDPCLRSSDPKCYERNKDRYHPYLGYAPGITGSAPAVGGLSGATAVGSVGGHVGAAPVSATPRKVETPLIFLDPPPEQQKKRRWR